MTYRASRSPSASSPADRNTVLTSAAGAEHTAEPSDMHPADMPHLRWLEGNTRFLRFCAEPRTGGPITLAWKLNSVGTKVIGALRKVSQRSSGEALSLPTKFFSQLNLSWLTSIMVPPHGLGKDVVAGALARP